MSDQRDGPREVAQALLELGEAGRLARSEAYVSSIRQITVKRPVEGSFVILAFVGDYAVNIRFLGMRRTFHCECADHAERRGEDGPCKHLLALAKVVVAKT